MASSQKSTSINRCINAVIKRMNDSALTRRPLATYRKQGTPGTTSVRSRKRVYYAESDEDDSSPDYDPSLRDDDEDDDGQSISKRNKAKKSKRTPLSVCNVESSSTSPRQSCVAKKPKLESPKPRQSSNSKIVSAIGDDQNLWGAHLPLDILHNVFRMALLSESTIPFLAKMQKVCRLWRQAALSSHLWSIIDLDYLKNRKPETIFSALSNHSIGIRDLSVSRWEKLLIRDLEEFLKSTKDVRALNVSFCRMLDLRRLLCVVVPQYCPKLDSLDLSYIDPTGHKKVTAVLREFLSLENGRRLKSLYLNGNSLADLRRLCADSALNKATANISVLHLSRVCMAGSGTEMRKIRLVDFVNAFPNLRILHMADAMLDFMCTADEEKNLLSDGWPNLYDCNIAVSSNWHRYNEVYDVFIRVLGRCKNLRRLDLSGFNVQDRLIWLRETPLTHLNLSKVRNMAKNAVTIDFFSTWGTSLETLCMAWVIGCVGSLCSLFAAAKERGFTPRLKRLDLTGTCVTATQLRILLDVCQSLEFVDVQSCRGMPLGMKRAYDGRDEITALREKLGSGNRATKK